MKERNHLYFGCSYFGEEFRTFVMKQHFASVHAEKKPFKCQPKVKCEPPGVNLKWGTIIPLIGGSSIGCSLSAYNLPAFQLSYTRYKKNEAHLERYWPKVPKYYIDKDQTLENMTGVAHREEDRGLVGHFYDMKNRFWAVGCGLGWAVE
jgi:hypothetical protein